MSPKKISPAEARQKIYHYCAYQERSHQEVRNKLYEYGLRVNEIDEILASLITEGFLNEERFAKAFAGGKFRMKNWGRVKIVRALQARGLIQNSIKAGLKEIEDTQYVETLNKLIKKKSDQLTDEDEFKKQNKLAQYAIQKGYEPDLVWNAIKNLQLTTVMFIALLG